MNKKIIWEKWCDPLNSNLDEVEWPGFDLDENDEQVPYFSNKQLKIIQTPLGFVSALDSSLANTHIDFWIMHTNFDITPEVRDVIITTDGVETFEEYTRYKARIGFPKTDFFKPRNIMSQIQTKIEELDKNKQLLITSMFPENTQNKIQETIAFLKERNKYWTIFILPNGNIDLITSEVNDDMYKTKVKEFIEIYQNIGGQIIESES